MLVVVGVVWLASSEVGEGEGGAVNPGELTLIKEVSQTNPSPCRFCQSGDDVLLLLGEDRGQETSSCLTVQDGLQIVSWMADKTDAGPAGVGVAFLTTG